LILIHRWLGVGLCLFFVLWFLSGIGMMYWEFPDVGPADRLAHASALDPDAVRLTPAEAFAKTRLSEPVTNASLAVFDGRPAYRFRSGRRDATVYADSGEVRGDITQEMMLRVATAWTGQAAGPVTVESIDDVDQWTIQVRGLKPLWKYAWASGEHVYVSQASGEVVQYTTTASRLGAYLGPIPHWLYFTPLRKHAPLWSTLVIWLSGLGTGTAILGIIIGISVFSPGGRYRIAGVPVRIPYSGAKRWHAVLGLIVGLAAATWAFSGMLSMGPFFWQGAGGSRLGADALSRRLRGNVRVADFDTRSPREALQLVGVKVRELELVEVAETPFYIASAGLQNTRIVPLDGPPEPAFNQRLLQDAVTSSGGSVALREFGLIYQYDRYYLDRRRALPLPVFRVRLDDPARTHYYIDATTARVVGSYSSRDWVTRWAYHGLHSLDFPWLYNHRPLWDIVVITFMLGGAALSVTSVILAWRVLGMRIRGLL